MPTSNRPLRTNASPALRRMDPRRAVRQFREILLWPLQLLPCERDTQTDHRDAPSALAASGTSHWAETASAIPVDPRALKEHVYREFVSFLPHVQRFLYGGGRGRDGSDRVFSRTDIARARVTLTSGATPLLFDVARVELHFFCDVDVAVLAVEIEGRDLAFDDVQDVMYRFGRSYPSGWTDRGEAWHCPQRVEWLDREGGVLATSDYEQRDSFLASVCGSKFRPSRRIGSSCWRRSAQGGEAGPLSFGLVEHNWIPLMAYLAVPTRAASRRTIMFVSGWCSLPAIRHPLHTRRHSCRISTSATVTTAFTTVIAPATGSIRASCAAATPS